MDKLLEKLSGVLTESDVTEFKASVKQMIKEAVDAECATEKAKVELDSEEKTKTAIKKKEDELEEAFEVKVKEVETNLIEQLDTFLESQVLERLDEAVAERIGQERACKPLVDALMEAFSTHYVEVDTQGHGLLKEAATEIQKGRDELSAQIDQTLVLEAELNDVKKGNLIAEKTKTLTEEQKTRVNTMFADKTLEECEAKLDTFMSLITEDKKEPEIKKEDGKVKLVTESVVSDEDKAEIVKTKGSNLNETAAFANSFL